MGNSHSTHHQKALGPPEESLHNNNNTRSTVVPMNSRNVDGNDNAHEEEEEEIPQTMNRPQNGTSGKDLSSTSPDSTVNFSDQPVDSGSHARSVSSHHREESFVDNLLLREDDVDPTVVKTHSVFLPLEKPVKEPKTWKQRGQSVARFFRHPTTLAFFITLILGIITTEVEVVETQKSYEDAIRNEVENALEETAYVIQRRLNSFAQTHSLFSSMLQGELIDRVQSNRSLFTTGASSVFANGSSLMLSRTHSEVDAAVLWLPEVIHQQRTDFVEDMNDVTTSSIFGNLVDILEPKQNVSYSRDVDLSQLGYRNSSRKQSYFPIAGRTLLMRDNLQYRAALFDSLVGGLDMGSLTADRTILRTFEKAKNSGRPATTPSLRFGSAKYVIVAAPTFHCKSLPCPLSTFAGIVGLVVDSDSIVSALYDLLKEVIDLAEIGVLVEDVSETSWLQELQVKNGGDDVVHGNAYGEGYFINGFIDISPPGYEGELTKETLLSLDSFTSQGWGYKVKERWTANRLVEQYNLEMELDHSFIVTLGSRSYNAKNLILPESLRSIKEEAQADTDEVRLIGYISTVTAALVVMTSVFMYTRSRERSIRLVREAAASLEAATDAHERTLSFAQHEIRNPLHVITASSSSLKEIANSLGEQPLPRQTTISKFVYQHGAQIAEYAMMMNRLVNDMMDLVKLQAGKLEFDFSSVNVKCLIRDLAKSQRRQSNADLSFSISPALEDACIRVDHLRLQQVLHNGLTHAVSHCSGGHVKFHVDIISANSLEEAASYATKHRNMACDTHGKVVCRAFTKKILADSTNWLMFRVIDTGVSMRRDLPKTESQDKLKQGNTSESSSTPSQRWAFSSSKGCSRCSSSRSDTVDADAKKSTQASQDRKDEYSGLGIQVARNIASALEGSLDVREERIRIIGPSTPGVRSSSRVVTVFEFIMPYTAAEESLTSAESSDITVNLNPEEGCFLYGTVPKVSNPKVVIVDDDAVNRKVLSRMLKTMGLSFVALKDGDEVIPHVTQVDEESSKNAAGTTTTNSGSAKVSSDDVGIIIFMDIHMRRMDGDVVCRKLRTEFNWDLPIIAMSGNTSAQEIESYKQNGFSGVMGKPFTKNSVKRLIDYLSDS